MSFRHRMSELVLITQPSRGMAESKLSLWQKCLDDAKEALLDRKMSKEDYKNACMSVDALATKSHAQEHSPSALQTYRYLAETQTRALLSAAYEEKLPFQCSFQWSPAECERRLSQLGWLFKNVTSCYTSRIIRYFPVAVIATIIDIIATGKGSDIKWWDIDENRKLLMWKAKKMMQGFNNLKLSKEDGPLIKACIKLIYEVSLQLPHFDNDKFLLNDCVSEMEEEFTSRVSITEQRITDQPFFLYIKLNDAQKISQLVRAVNPVMGAEMSMSIMLQSRLLESSKSRDVGALCFNEVVEDGSQSLFCLDNIFIDCMRLLSDVAKCVRELQSSDNRELVEDLLNFCGEYMDESGRVHSRKLFMLAIVLMEGIDITKLDNSDIVSDILERIDNEGNFVEGRKRRVNMKKRQNPRARQKRGPCFQPAARIRRRRSSDEDDSTSPPRKRVKKKVKPVEYVAVAEDSSEEESVAGDDDGDRDPANFDTPGQETNSKEKTTKRNGEDREPLERDTNALPTTSAARQDENLKEDLHSKRQDTYEVQTPASRLVNGQENPTSKPFNPHKPRTHDQEKASVVNTTPPSVSKLPSARAADTEESRDNVNVTETDFVKDIFGEDSMDSPLKPVRKTKKGKNGTNTLSPETKSVKEVTEGQPATPSDRRSPPRRSSRIRRKAKK